MSIPTKRTVMVTREIVATSSECGHECQYLTGDGYCEFRHTSEQAEKLEGLVGFHKFKRTQACLDGEIAARGGVI